MATASTPSLSLTSTVSFSPSPPLKGIKKVFSSRRRSSEAQSDDGALGRRSLDSLDRSPTLQSTRSSPSRDEHKPSISDGIHKLIPGHSKRQRQRMREAELEAIEQKPIRRGRSPEAATLPPPSLWEKSRSTSSLLTDGSENDTPPPLASRSSHTGYFTTSSPLITSKTLNDMQQDNTSRISIPSTMRTEEFPMIVEPENRDSGGPPSIPPQLKLDETPVLSSPGLVDRGDTLQVDRSERRGSISRLRAKSPARKLRDVFSRSSKSPRTSPERSPVSRPTLDGPVIQEQPNLAERRLVDNPAKVPPPVLNDLSSPLRLTSSPPRKPLAVDTEAAPKTPPSARLNNPLTTITPPTPTDAYRGDITASPSRLNEAEVLDDNVPDKTSTTPNSSISHRRVRSGSANTHQKSKLSLSMMPPLTPTIEESNKTPVDKPVGTRNFTANSGFFSSWMSAAQNAASSITNLTGQSRSRAGTSNSEPTAKAVEEAEERELETDEARLLKRKLAIETLGSGNLDFSHLGLETSNHDKSFPLHKSEVTSSRKKADLERDEERAKVEDVLAKRAVSAAYGDPMHATPVAELPDPVVSMRSFQALENRGSGTLTPPNGSIADNDGQGVKRSSSVRSKLGKRRSRGSSVATGQSVVATTSNSATTLVIPSTPRITGFTPAPKQRNRGFHQQFRSVPEDDNLIEDYSCALQKEILLAGRIYISEGHICFSSNILGWVTTLIISFEEIVSIERENTAMIIPNAIAIQTLHARHTFRSLLSREATFDLMIGIWKVNHPASFSKSVNGKLVAEQARREAETSAAVKSGDGEIESEGSSDESSGSDDDDDDNDSAASFLGSIASVAGSEIVDTKTVARKPSGSNILSAQTNGVVAAGGTGDAATTAAAVAGMAPGATPDFPGPVTHAPTECNDSATHYDKILKDEVIPAPLGKIYSLLYGPQSGVFLRKYLVDECKSLDLVFEDDKKGLTNENKSRQYSYIKPLGGSIGPKQTKCITTENLDFFDLDKAVSVTCTTQTPDVPSGNAFATKTRYCLSWAPGNATRLQMTFVIEWSAKSWLKGPIEKGANEGQQQYGDGLIKALKAALGRSRGATVSSKAAKGKKKRKGERKTKSERSEQKPAPKPDWGLFEPLRSTLGPVVGIIGPVVRVEVVVAVLFVMVLILWFGGNRSRSRQLGYLGSSDDRLERLVAYEQLWQREESELWDWLEDRAGVNRVLLGGPAKPTIRDFSNKIASMNRQKLSKDKNMAARLRAEKWDHQEMQEAVRVTRERLEEMQRVLDQTIG